MIKIYLDLNILLGKKELPEESIIPLLVIFELFTSDKIDTDRKKRCYERIKNMRIDPRLPFKNETKNMYDYTFIKDDIYKLSYEEFEKKGKMIFQEFKKKEKNIGYGFTEHKFITDEETKDKFNKCIRNNDDGMIELVKNLKEHHLNGHPYPKETMEIFNMEIYETIFIYYHYKSEKYGTPGRNDFTDLQYLLYLNGDNKLYTEDKDLEEALNRFFPDSLYRPDIGNATGDCH